MRCVCVGVDVVECGRRRASAGNKFELRAAALVLAELFVSRGETTRGRQLIFPRLM